MNLLERLQRLGDSEIDDLSAAHDALEEIISLRLQISELTAALKPLGSLSVPEDSGAYFPSDPDLPPDDVSDDYFIKYGHIRKARLLLAALGDE